MVRISDVEANVRDGPLVSCLVLAITEGVGVGQCTCLIRVFPSAMSHVPMTTANRFLLVPAPEFEFEFNSPLVPTQLLLLSNIVGATISLTWGDLPRRNLNSCTRGFETFGWYLPLCTPASYIAGSLLDHILVSGRDI